MKIAMPKPSPNRQNRMPIRSSLWPSIAPLKKVTCERSGSFSEASPPSPAGWAKAVAVPKVRSAAAAEILVAMRRVKNAAVARKVRIEVLRYKNGFKELQNVFRFCLPEACPSSRLRYQGATASTPNRSWRLGFRNSEHASTARPEWCVGAWPRRSLRQDLALSSLPFKRLEK